LFEASEVKVAREIPAPKPAAKKKSGHGRKLNPDSVPRRTIVCELPQEECVCGTCGEQMTSIGFDVVERADVIPAQVIVNHYKQSK
jgi:transposase